MYPPPHEDLDAKNRETDEDSDEEAWLEQNCGKICYPTPKTPSQDHKLEYIFTSQRAANLMIYRCIQHVEQCRIWSELTSESLNNAKAMQDHAMVSQHQAELRILCKMISTRVYQMRIAKNPWAYTIPADQDSEFIFDAQLVFGSQFVVTLAGSGIR